MTIAVAFLDAVAVVLERATGSLLARLADEAWVIVHRLGGHRWRDGYAVDVEAGWRQYRGSRCAICDIPWEGW